MYVERRPPLRASGGRRSSAFAAATAIVLLSVTAQVCAAGVGDDADIPVMTSDRLAIACRAASGIGGLTRVDVWQTPDLGENWTRATTWRSAGANRPARVDSLDDAPGEIGIQVMDDGLWGFYVVLHNAAGASAPDPASGTKPHRWVRVDRAAPRVKLLGVRPDDRFAATREVQFRWSAEDANLIDRPVALHYRTEKTRSYRLIAENLAAQGGFRWTAPPEIRGRVDIRVTARDMAGRRGRAVSDRLCIDDRLIERTSPPSAPLRTPRNEPVAGAGAVAAADIWEDLKAVRSEPQGPAVQISRRAADDADRLYERGTWHRIRGEYDLAAARYREAIAANPQLTQARHDLAGLLILDRLYEEAGLQLSAILRQNPDDRDALKLLALVQSKSRNYRSASRALEALLRLDPHDAEAWLNLGDVALFMGDRARARSAWSKAMGLDGASPELRGRAQQRIDLYRDHPESTPAADRP